MFSDHTYLPAQKPKKPDHVDSYNPPFEYQISDEDAPGTNGHVNHATRTLFNALRRVRKNLFFLHAATILTRLDF